MVVKTAGASGQISLGKEFADRQVTVERLGDGRWAVVEVDIIPKHERIFHTPEAKASAQRSAEWLAQNAEVYPGSPKLQQPRHEPVKLPVNFAPIADLNNENAQSAILNITDYPAVTDPVAP